MVRSSLLLLGILTPWGAWSFPAPITFSKREAVEWRCCSSGARSWTGRLESSCTLLPSTGGGGVGGFGGAGGVGGNGGAWDSFGHWRGGGDGDGDSSAGEPGDPDLTIRVPEETENLLSQWGRDLSSLPAGVRSAVAAGSMTPPLLSRYLEIEKLGGFYNWLLQFGGFRDRMLMDVGFLTKVAIEMAVGGAAQVLAEYRRRKEHLFEELDFAIADVLTCLVANFAAVWLSAPAIGAVSTSSFMRNIPDNAFQTVPPGGRPYSLFYRGISPFFKVPMLFGVGFFATAVGYGSTALLGKLRQHMAGESADKQEDMSVFKTCVAVGVYLAVSTNLRYQLISGVIEQRMLDKVFANNALASRTGSFIVRSLNTYIGSALMIDYLKLVGLQS